jgi:hypothetical protein
MSKLANHIALFSSHDNTELDIEWKLYGPLLEIAWILMIHNNCIFSYYGYSIEIVWIYYGFSGSIVSFIVWISHFFPSDIW